MLLDAEYPGLYPTLEAEATCFSHGCERVALAQRKGFVKSSS